MNLFINEQVWNKYAETIAMEDIREECEIYFPETKENYEQSYYKKEAQVSRYYLL